MTTLIKCLCTVILFFYLIPAVRAQAPSNQSEDYQSGNLVIHDNSIQTRNIYTPSPPTRESSRGQARHSTRAEKQISEDKLKLYLSKSPLREHTAQLLQSPYYSTIIGICWIEQYGCTKAPHNNYWGIGGSKGLAKYDTLSDGITAISTLLGRYNANGYNTIEKLNGYYVQPASANWLNTVLKIKQEVENL